MSSVFPRSSTSFVSQAHGTSRFMTQRILRKSTTRTFADLAYRLDGLEKPTVWHEFSPLASKHGAINLGQGFPDWEPPEFVLESMMRSTDPRYDRHANQYARSYAHFPLANVLALEYNERFFPNSGHSKKIIDPATHVATAVGCTNALFCAMQGLINPGNEVVLMEPAFDIYSAQVRMAGGKPVFVPLRPQEDTSLGASAVFNLDLQELEDAITPETRVLLINTPHNPTGKIFSKAELEGIAKIIERHPHVTVISDEVYEHITFDPVNEPHISFASLPGMYDHTLTLSSSGKTFSCTGWKVGWAIGPPHLTRAVSSVQQWVNFSAPTPNQDAIAQSLERAKSPYRGFKSYYEYLAAEYKRKRGLLVDALETAGMTPVIPNGGFFIMADTSNVDFPNHYLDDVTEAMPANPMPRDWAMSRWMTQEVGVTAIPPSAFYGQDTLHLAKNLLRFAYCKDDNTILEAHKRLKKYFD
eukprot:CAMPEP_0195282358 /NCGR_PEP_ID=MMETSP0707-20130614/1264_1 /TAXON_ID=33640 /ORGANISM="Asterionellopsis glacialis, Strain CCMP134" /LENGTH=470 /DNA_ID=CAMNT_0040341321 /DNA_START=89 /DNA_END=1501 /DNA_ORIENTATION=-